MAEIIRLKRWRDYGLDGRSYIEATPLDKSKVAIAVIVGFEPGKPSAASECVAVDDVILDIARHIRASRNNRSKKGGG